MQDVEEKSRRFLEGKMTSSFRINMHPVDAYKSLLSYYISAVRLRNVKCELDEDTRNNIYRLALALTSTTPKAGVMLCGTCGNGKTTLVYAMRFFINELNSRGHFSFLDQYFRAAFKIYDAKEIVMLSRSYKDWKAITSDHMLAIDDLGKEPTEIMDYGNLLSPVVDLLERRYNEQRFTIVTTNLLPRQLSEKYGARMQDRFREMFEVIHFKQKSYRGNSKRV